MYTCRYGTTEIAVRVLQCVAVRCSVLHVLTKKTNPFWVSFDAHRCGGE